MITTGSKYFYGVTALATIAMVLYMLFVNPNDIGAVALGSLAAAAALLGGLTSFTRDSIAHTATEAVAAAEQPAPAAVWPLIVAVGIVMLVFGLATNPIVFVLGIVALVAGGVEWLVQDYASRASADSTFNSQLRGRLLHPLEFPVAAAVVVGRRDRLHHRLVAHLGRWFPRRTEAEHARSCSWHLVFGWRDRADRSRHRHRNLW
jgi:hypothetical protein